LYAESDPGVIGVRLDCIIACKAPGDDALSLTSLITKNRAGDSCYSISSIEDRVLVLDGGNTSVVTTAVDQYGKHFGWWEATETVSLYKREPIPSPTDASNNYTINDNGITISGGWNRTDMSTQSGETWIDGFRTYSGFIISAKNNITIEDIALTRFNGSISISGANSNNLTLTNFTQNAITSTGINVGSIAANQPSKITFNGYIRSIGCRNTNATSGINTTDAFGGYTIPLLDFSNCEVFCHGGGTFLTISGVDNVVFDVINCYESYTPLSVTTTSNVYIDVLNVVDSFLGMICNNGGFIRVRQCTIDYADYAVFVSRGQNSIKIQDYSDTNLLYVVYHTLGLSVIEVQNFDSSFVTGLYGTANPSNTYFSQMQLRLGNYGGVSTDHRTYFSYAGEILSETSVRHTASGYAWKMTPETTLFDTVQTAIKMLVGKVYVEASKVVTVTGWVRRTHTDIKIGLIAFKSQLAGMTADYSDEITAAIDTWEELSFTFTPTEAGVVEIYAYCYGSLTESGYVDDIDITQAA
jgi:hypothetical protein